MIVFFCYNSAFLKYLVLPLKHFKYKYVVLNDFNKYYFEEAKVIIPIGIWAQNEIKNYYQYREKFLISSRSTYQLLDDKIKFYEFIKHYDLLKGTGIKLIPTYDSLREPDRYGSFIIKEKNGAGSGSNNIKNEYLHKLIKKYSDECQIQDLIDIKYIYSINCFCANGKLLSSINFIIDGFIKQSFYDNNNIMYVHDVGKKFKTAIKNIVKKINYNGFIEIEFIVSTDHKIYLMECNPRVSSNMLCVEDNGDVPFNENLFYPYIDYIRDKKIKFKTYDGVTNVLYCGGESIANQHMHNNNVLHIVFHKDK